MKMGTTSSPWRYEIEAYAGVQPIPRSSAISNCETWIAITPAIARPRRKSSVCERPKVRARCRSIGQDSLLHHACSAVSWWYKLRCEVVYLRGIGFRNESLRLP
jgi:hypothetical protein